MNSVIEAIVGILMLVLVGTGLGKVYHAVKKETVIQVHRGLSPLGSYSERLTQMQGPGNQQQPIKEKTKIKNKL